MRSLGFNELRTYTLLPLKESEMFNYNFNKTIKLNRPMLQEKSYSRSIIVM